MSIFAPKAEMAITEIESLEEDLSSLVVARIADYGSNSQNGHFDKGELGGVRSDPEAYFKATTREPQTRQDIDPDSQSSEIPTEPNQVTELIHDELPSTEHLDKITQYDRPEITTAERQRRFHIRFSADQIMGSTAKKASRLTTTTRQSLDPLFSRLKESILTDSEQPVADREVIGPKNINPSESRPEQVLSFALSNARVAINGLKRASSATWEAKKHISNTYRMANFYVAKPVNMLGNLAISPEHKTARRSIIALGTLAVGYAVYKGYLDHSHVTSKHAHEAASNIASHHAQATNETTIANSHLHAKTASDSASKVVHHSKPNIHKTEVAYDFNAGPGDSITREIQNVGAEHGKHFSAQKAFDIYLNLKHKLGGHLAHRQYIMPDGNIGLPRGHNSLQPEVISLINKYSG